jgi:hypothetical protein
VTSERAIHRHAEAALVRKKAHQKRRTLVMRGRVEQLIRYVLSIPKVNRKEYKLVCGDKEYGLGRMERLARKLKMNVPGHDLGRPEVGANLSKSDKRKRFNLNNRKAPWR